MAARQHRDGGPGRRILVIASETVEGTVLHEAIRFRARNVGGRVLVVVPALTSLLRHGISDVDAARPAAEARLQTSLRRLRAAGIDADGHIGDGDPLQAMEDALRVFAADEIVVATHPQERSHWLARDLIARAPLRFDQPVLHIVVDLARHREDVLDPEPAAAS